MKPDAPPAPDFAGAARAQGAANVDTARVSSMLSNPNIITPLGTQRVTYGNPIDEDAFNQRYTRAQQINTDHIAQYGVPHPQFGAAGYASQLRAELGGGNQDMATVTQELSPEGQRRFDQESRINAGLGNLAETGLGYVQNTLSTPFDQSALPDAARFNDSNLPGRAQASDQTRQRVEDALYQRATSRMDPRFQREEESLRNRLANQGLAAGGEAWGTEMRDFRNAKDDAYQMALRDAIVGGGAEQSRLYGMESDARSRAFNEEQARYGMDSDARSRAIGEQEFFRTEPLNILNAVRSAAPVQVPQFQNYSGVNAAPPPIFNAAQNQGMFDMNRHAIDTGAYNNMMGGLFDIGAAFAGRRP